MEFEPLITNVFCPSACSLHRTTVEFELVEFDFVGILVGGLHRTTVEFEPSTSTLGDQRNLCLHRTTVEFEP